MDNCDSFGRVDVHGFINVFSRLCNVKMELSRRKMHGAGLLNIPVDTALWINHTYIHTRIMLTSDYLFVYSGSGEPQVDPHGRTFENGL